MREIYETVKSEVMFKVMCIKDNWNPERGMESAPYPVVGDEDVVISVIDRNGASFYVLERFGWVAAYMTDHFATTDSDIDESTLVNSRPETASA